MKIAGFWNGHDCSFCVLENGRPIIHAELERYIREKEPRGDSYPFFKDVMKNYETDYSVIGSPADLYSNQYDYEVGHHQAHAANAFFSSNHEKALIVTIDGGGVEQNDDVGSCMTIWQGNGNKIEPLLIIPTPNDRFTDRAASKNIGGLWREYTGRMFGLNTGHPYGNQAGTVMAMAAYGDKDKYYTEMNKGLYTFLYKHLDLSEDEKYHVAAALQHWTELTIKDFIEFAAEVYTSHTGETATNLCLAGGVALNCVATGKMYDWFNFENIYVTPTPHDGGLSIGVAQYVWHHVMDNPRIDWKDNFTPYLGEQHYHRHITAAISKKRDMLKHKTVTDDDVVDLLMDQKIISVFGGGSESGRRALGNRSIIADPRNIEMKDLINEKVKHRQWFRPFAPSILREEVKNWFEKDIDSPYMGFAIAFKDIMKEKAPAVCHDNGTARLQTVTLNDNPWYYKLIKKFKEKTGVPILLNTSFNDREPIVETPEDAINCFLGTNIDYLYFRESGILIEKFKPKALV